MKLPFSPLLPRGIYWFFTDTADEDLDQGQGEQGEEGVAHPSVRWITGFHLVETSKVRPPFDRPSR
jgi:hypothetical protein